MGHSGTPPSLLHPTLRLSSGAMEGLVPVLCALLMSAEFAGGKKEPGVNLSCYQCFKAASQALCTPTVCDPSDRVCVSNTVVLLRKASAPPLNGQSEDSAEPGTERAEGTAMSSLCPLCSTPHPQDLQASGRARVVQATCVSREKPPPGPAALNPDFVVTTKVTVGSHVPTALAGPTIP
ncbi:lymphocyte antigen 6L isoform X3 [Ursus maritimus]|uniref:Lymphocyte antigen 6L isoform X3 n=2 Tax=Ursus TaxID=9639 RepID=A0A8M1FML9_URSMA|nr:lymphocyte antigen 6L isoform X3 [Ursus maritimus]